MEQNWKYRAILRREEILKPKLKEAAEKQRKLRLAETKAIPKSIFDRTLRKISVSDRDKIACWEEDKDYFSENKQIVFRGSYTWYPIGYHLITRFIPFIAIMLYVNSQYSY